MREITQKYKEVCTREEAERENLYQESHRCKEELDRLESECAMCRERLGSLRRRYENFPRTDWLEGLVYPLADALGDATGLHLSVFGEHGFFYTGIYLTEYGDGKFSNKPYVCIKVKPVGRELHYRNDKAEFVPLPDTIEEIVPLFRGNLQLPFQKGGPADGSHG